MFELKYRCNFRNRTLLSHCSKELRIWKFRLSEPCVDTKTQAGLQATRVSIITNIYGTVTLCRSRTCEMSPIYTRITLFINHHHLSNCDHDNQSGFSRANAQQLDSACEMYCRVRRTHSFTQQLEKVIQYNRNCSFNTRLVYELGGLPGY